MNKYLSLAAAALLAACTPGVDGEQARERGLGDPAEDEKVGV